MSGGMAGAWKWKSAMVLLNVGMVGMVMAMLVSGKGRNDCLSWREFPIS